MLQPALLVLFSGWLLAADSWSNPQVLANVKIRGLSEVSGIAASRKHPGVFWFHNDSGNRPELFAIDRDGNLKGRIAIPAAKMQDWEAISIANNGTIYIGDIGDNQERRSEIQIYYFKEPALTAKSVKAEVLRLRYPDGSRDAEALLVHPKTRDIYIITKSDLRPRVYRARRGSNLLEHVGTLSMFTLLGITGGEFSPDGSRVVLCDYFRGFEAAFDPRWKQRWNSVDLGPRKQGEAVTFTHDGNAIIAASEGANFPLVEVRRE